MFIMQCQHNEFHSLFEAFESTVVYIDHIYDHASIIQSNYDNMYSDVN